LLAAGCASATLIFGEDREYFIFGEDREYFIFGEDREYFIFGEDREYFIFGEGDWRKSGRYLELGQKSPFTRIYGEMVLIFGLTFKK
jgi:hypothetical protein